MQFLLNFFFDEALHSGFQLRDLLLAGVYVVCQRAHFGVVFVAYLFGRNFFPLLVTLCKVGKKLFELEMLVFDDCRRPALVDGKVCQRFESLVLFHQRKLGRSFGLSFVLLSG